MSKWGATGDGGMTTGGFSGLAEMSAMKFPRACISAWDVMTIVEPFILFCSVKVSFSIAVERNCYPGAKRKQVVDTQTMNPTKSVSTFTFNTSQIRVVTHEGNPWFVAADICRVLELSNVTNTLRSRYIDHSERATSVEGSGNPYNIIPESGLYKLIMRSDKPQAKTFQDWVTKEVLPSIRKTGAYVVGAISLTSKTLALSQVI